jgi:hypothetical protein
MSIILDALQRGRRGQTPAQDPRTAQTDAVLQTLGYGRPSAGNQSIRFNRTLTAAALGLVLGIVLWAAWMWTTRT